MIGRVMFRTIVAAVSMILAAPADPFSPLAPAVALSASQLGALDRGEIVALIIPARHGQIAAFAATRIEAPPDVLVSAARNIADLRKSHFVQATARFSDPARLADLDQLRLSDRDVQALAGCEIGACSFKLTALEIDTLKRLRHSEPQRESVTAAFKQVLLDRVAAYRAAGLAALPPIANRRKPWRLQEILVSLHGASPLLLRQPPLDAWIADRDAGVESFVYWSQEYYGAGKPVILVVDVAIYRPSRDAVVVVGKQVFSNRYMNGALSVMTLTTDERGTRYLTYLNRTAVDLTGGVFGGIARSLLESEIADGLPAIISGLRVRLERSSHATSVDSVRHH